MKTSIRIIEPLINTEQLAKQLSIQDLTIVDIRSANEYKEGHIKTSVSIPFDYWAISKDGLDLELPEEKELTRLINTAGINTDSSVIIVNNTDNTYSLANSCRVADTLIYTGISNVSILDGGYEKWIRENRKLTIVPSNPKPSNYRIVPDEAMFVSMNYVQSKIGKSVLIDARDPEVYFGILQEDHATRSGHIPGAKSLPAPWIWTDEFLYKSREELSEISENIVGKKRDEEIIIYCGVGGYTSAWWYVLTQMLGYKNVKFYDGSAQDWTRDPQNPVVKYKWE